MSDANLTTLRDLLTKCSPEDRAALFRELRAVHQIHEFESVIGAPAEMILEAVHRAPELTRRMLRGVIADAAFRQFVVPAVAAAGWRDITPPGNFAYDYALDDGAGAVTVQVKLQRSEVGVPVVHKGTRYGLGEKVFVTETQKTRTGTKRPKNGVSDDVVEEVKTRPYRYGEFDVLAVSMQPSTGKWDQFMYTLGRWLLSGKRDGEMATFQPVEMQPGELDGRLQNRCAVVPGGGRREADETCPEGPGEAGQAPEEGLRRRTLKRSVATRFGVAFWPFSQRFREGGLYAGVRCVVRLPHKDWDCWRDGRKSNLRPLPTSVGTITSDGRFGRRICRSCQIFRMSHFSPKRSSEPHRGQQSTAGIALKSLPCPSPDTPIERRVRAPQHSATTKPPA